MNTPSHITPGAAVLHNGKLHLVEKVELTVWMQRIDSIRDTLEAGFAGGDVSPPTAPVIQMVRGDIDGPDIDAITPLLPQ